MPATRPKSTDAAFARLATEVAACALCPRLARYRAEVAKNPPRAFVGETYWARGVPGYGDPQAAILAVGLAPAAHGANRTGRMFTGDGQDGMGSSDFLARALHRVGLASQPTSRRREDGQRLTGLYLTAICRCAPPDNKPSPEEIARCAPFLARELELLSTVRVVVALGKLAFDQTLRVLAERGAAAPRPKPAFGHAAEVDLGGGFPRVLGSYHPSRQNTQTGKLTPDMLASVFERAIELAAAGAGS
jgi:uracil-DNA glycosylase family 4